MNLFSINNISKSFEQTLLFEGISFGMDEGDRVGLIGRNGIGKSTLLHIIAGKEEPDTGVVAFNKAIRTEFLNQLPSFDKHMSVLDIVMSGKPEEYRILCRHEELCNADIRSDAEEEELHAVTLQIDEKSAWNLRSTATGFLHSLGVTFMDADVMSLSGGQRKRVALARALLSQPDLLILDEPTNHLDAGIVQWLQDELQRSAKGVLLVTHDRYFLDAVSSRIVELDQKRLFSFDGNYEKYLERKEAMIAADDATQAHERNKLRHELAWLQKGAKARRTKQQSRINWIEKMQVEKAEAKQREIELEVGSVFLGGRIIDAYNISKTMRDKVVFRDFEYSAAPGDKIGFIGPNGAGKSTLLNVLAGSIAPDTGSVRIGDTVRIGYFKQEVPHLPPTQTVIGAVRAIAEYIDGGVGREKYISARELLERFRFPSHRHGSRVETLSGGERRRLELCRVLMANPNVLMLDEPTNDFDLATLSALEEYLVAFKGVLLVVSHDRAFLDKTVEFIYAFEEGGKIKQYPGNYTAYLHAVEQRTLEQRRTNAEARKDSSADRAADSNADKAADGSSATSSHAKARSAKGLSYKEQKELESISVTLEALAAEQQQLEHDLANTTGAAHELLARISTRLQEISAQSDELTERWFELEEKKSAR